MMMREGGVVLVYKSKRIHFWNFFHLANVYYRAYKMCVHYDPDCREFEEKNILAL